MKMRVFSPSGVANIWEKYWSFYLDGKFFDVTLLCQGQEFGAHGMVLVGACSIFMLLLEQAIFVELHGMTPDEFGKIIQFCYSGSVKLLDTELLRFEELAKVFALDMAVENNSPSGDSQARRAGYNCPIFKKTLASRKHKFVHNAGCFRCDLCPKTYTSKDNLKQHRDRVHS